MSSVFKGKLQLKLCWCPLKLGLSIQPTGGCWDFFFKWVYSYLFLSGFSPKGKERDLHLEVVEGPIQTLLEPQNDDHFITKLWSWIWQTFQGTGDVLSPTECMDDWFPCPHLSHRYFCEKDTSACWTLCFCADSLPNGWKEKRKFDYFFKNLRWLTVHS